MICICYVLVILRHDIDIFIDGQQFHYKQSISQHTRQFTQDVQKGIFGQIELLTAHIHHTQCFFINLL